MGRQITLIEMIKDCEDEESKATKISEEERRRRN